MLLEGLAAQVEKEPLVVPVVLPMQRLVEQAVQVLPRQLEQLHWLAPGLQPDMLPHDRTMDQARIKLVQLVVLEESLVIPMSVLLLMDPGARM